MGEEDKPEIFLYEHNLEELNGFTRAEHGKEYRIASLERITVDISGNNRDYKEKLKDELSEKGYAGAIHYEKRRRGISLVNFTLSGIPVVEVEGEK